MAYRRGTVIEDTGRTRMDIDVVKLDPDSDVTMFINFTRGKLAIEDVPSIVRGIENAGRMAELFNVDNGELH